MACAGAKPYRQDLLATTTIRAFKLRMADFELNCNIILRVASVFPAPHADMLCGYLSHAGYESALLRTGTTFSKFARSRFQPGNASLK